MPSGSDSVSLEKIKMKKLVFALALIAFWACSDSKKKTAEPVADSSLEKRLDEYMKLTDEMKLDELMDYIYPKLFTIAPREQMVAAMKATFENEQVKADLDSVKITKIYPVFTEGKGSYAKVGYSMVMLMSFNLGDSTGESDPSQMDMIKSTLSDKYGDENVSIEGRLIKIRQNNFLVAAKDEFAKEWSFVSWKKEDPLMNRLFTDEVLAKLDTYK